MSLRGWKLYLVLTWLMLTAFSTGVSLMLARQDVNRIQSILFSEKVCSETHQGQPCRDLFQRLANNISDAQRRQLACVVFRTAGVKPNIKCPEG